MIKNIKSKTDLAGFFIVFKGSTLNESKGTYGISHFIEHLFSKPFDKYEEKFNIDAINYNAYTSNNEVVFFINGLDSKVYKWRDKLIDSFNNIKTITPEDFENEKKVVLEEYNNSFNDQLEWHILNLNRKMLNDYNPIGLKEDIENFTYDNFIEYSEKYFKTPSLIINVSKNYKYKNKNLEFNQNIFDNKLTIFDNNNNFILEDSNDFKNKSSIVISSPIIEEDFAYIKYINTMLNLGLSSPLTKEIRVNRGLVYGIYNTFVRYNEEAINYTYCLTNNENVNELIDVYKSIISNPQKYLTKKSFEVSREYFKNKAKINNIKSYDNIAKYLTPTNDFWFVDDILKNVKYDKVLEVYNKYFDVNKLHYSIDKNEFKK